VIIVGIIFFSLLVLFKQSLFNTAVIILVALSLYLLSFVPHATKTDALWDAYMTMGRVERKSERLQKEKILKIRMHSLRKR
jgi:hypothetical protein